jgi:uncharacterized membrane protein YgdD (TMEM256/DUF423 family)
MAGESDTVQRLVLASAGLVGAVGIGAAAAASHGDSRNLAAIAAICLAHGPALLALGLVGRGRALGLAAALMAAGTVVFVSDLGMREWLGHALFSGAAPLGGAGMIGGWLTIVVAAFVDRR